MSCKIEFFQNNKSLGVFDCPERSSLKERDEVAANHGIDHYDRFILDNGRVTARMLKDRYVDTEGRIWIYKTKNKRRNNGK
jgi:hypothetical protein